MLSSNSLIKFVFAHEDDTYYSDGLLKMNLDQFLWLKLHEAKYDTVYFVTINDNRLKICHYGEPEARLPKPAFIPIINKTEKWISDKLAEKNSRNAFVFSIDDFCSIFENAKNCKPLTEIADNKSVNKRTGTIVLKVSPFIERSREYILKAKVFEHLKDNDILYLRNNKRKILYDELKAKKDNSCVFLNIFNKNNITSLMKHLVWNNPERFESMEQLELEVKYLTLYFSNRALQWNVEIFENNTVISTHYFSMLYEQLEKKEVWNKLVRETKEFSNANGKERYLAQKKINSGGNIFERYSGMFITRDTNIFPGKCLLIRPYVSDNEKGEFFEENLETLEHISHNLLIPYNCEENEKVKEFLENSVYSAIVSSSESNDHGTYYRVLNVMDICVENLYIPPNSEEETAFLEKLGNYENYFRVSAQYSDSIIQYKKVKKAVDNGYGNSDITEMQFKHISVIMSKTKEALDMMDNSILQKNVNLSKNNQFLNQIMNELCKSQEELRNEDGLDKKTNPEDEKDNDAGLTQEEFEKMNMSDRDITMILNEISDSY